MRKPDRQYLEEMSALVAILISVGRDRYENVEAFSKAAKLSDQTIYNLASGQTRLPQFYTLVKLGRATGFSIELKKSRIRLKVA